MLSILTGPRQTGNLRLWTLGVCLAAVSAACDKVPLLAPPSSTIRLSATTTNVQANGTTEIRATVLEPSGTPVQNGTTVTFSTNLGAVSPAEARTVNGVAAAQFVGNGQSGKATLRAISGGAVSDPLELSVGAAAAGRVTVTASPNQIPAGGTSVITAIVNDTNGNPLSGVLVSFSTDAGSLLNSTDTTSSNGQARTSLTTTRDATVTANAGLTTTTGTSGTTTSAVSGSVKVTVGTLPDLTIAASGSPTEGQAVTFTIGVTGSATTETFQSLFVDFGDGTNSGPLSGSSQNVSHVYNRSGTYLVEVTGTSSSGTTKRATTTIVVAERGLVDVRITKNPDGPVNTNEPVTFTATATGGGTIRSYSWNFGDGRTFTGGSQVSHSYSTPGTKTVTVTATTTDGNSGRGQTQVVVEP